MFDPTAFSDPREVFVRRAPPLRFTCDWAHTGAGFAWVRAQGELDRWTASQLDLALRQAQLHAERVVLDLRDLEFMDAYGVRTIVESHGRAVGEGGCLLAIRGSEQIDRLLELSGLAEALELVELEPGEPPVQALLKSTGDHLGAA